MRIRCRARQRRDGASCGVRRQKRQRNAAHSVRRAPPYGASRRGMRAHDAAARYSARKCVCRYAAAICWRHAVFRYAAAMPTPTHHQRHRTPFAIGYSAAERLTLRDGARRSASAYACVKIFEMKSGAAQY